MGIQKQLNFPDASAYTVSGFVMNPWVNYKQQNSSNAQKVTVGPNKRTLKDRVIVSIVEIRGLPAIEKIVHHNERRAKIGGFRNHFAKSVERPKDTIGNLNRR